ncbi:hypothetical protein FACS1894176_09850 [Bacteroidia bacterium]|nr:hypothetical protein FACS1894176_09850 [Bacteroidia bacterium]
MKGILQGKKENKIQTLHDLYSYLGEDIENKGNYEFFQELSPELKEIVATVQIKPEVVEELKALIPSTFTGKAP